MFGFTILASAAFKGTIILIAAVLIAWSLRRRSAAARHLVWTAAAAALLALPILILLLPALRVPAKPAGAMALFQTFSSARATTSAAPVATVAGVVRQSASTGPGADPRQWVATIWAAGACLGILQMLFACAALRR